MNNSVCRWNIRGNHVAIVHLHLSVCLLQREWRSTGHRILDLIEAHSCGEQRALDEVLRHQFLGHLLVRHQIRQLLRGELGESLIRRRKDRVRFDA